MNIIKEEVAKITIFTVKLLLANLIAVLITSFFVPLFYFPPTPAYTLQDAPFYHRKPYAFVCRATEEGYVRGKLDSNGCNNLYCLEHNIQIQPPKQIGKHNLALILGASHMEAFQVPMNKNCCYLLNKMRELKDQDFLLYNIGFNAVYLPELTEKFEQSLDYFKPQRFVLVETKDLPQPSQIRKTVLEPKGKSNEPGSLYAKLDMNEVLSFVLKRAVALSAMRYHIRQGLLQLRRTKTVIVNEREDWNEENVVYLREFLKKFSEPSRIRGIKTVIFYHPRLTLHTNGIATLNDAPEIVELYKTECEKQGIVFVYLGDRFMKEYEENNVLPYGFWNTLPNSGHLNKEGHRMIAEELCKVIERLEEERKENVQ